MKIYISIPISGKAYGEQKARAAEIAEVLKQAGHDVVNPFDTPPPFEWYDEKQSYAYLLTRDIEQLMACEAIFMCDGWQFSRGCRIERNVAEEMGLQILTETKGGGV